MNAEAPPNGKKPCNIVNGIAWIPVTAHISVRLDPGYLVKMQTGICRG